MASPPVAWIETTSGAKEASPRPTVIWSGSRAGPNRPASGNLLAHHEGNIAAVGRALGKERMQIHRWLKRYDIDVEPYRP
jgi:transcriptional regulator of acetoin/glycerol metabolism